MTDTVDTRALAAEGTLEQLREAGAFFAPLPLTGPITAYEDAVRTMAYRGWCLPFRVDLNVDPYRNVLGYFGTNDAGHAHICFVHPDDREMLAWEMGVDLSVALTDSRFWRYVRELCRVP